MSYKRAVWPCAQCEAPTYSTSQPPVHRHCRAAYARKHGQAPGYGRRTPPKTCEACGDDFWSSETRWERRTCSTTCRMVIEGRKKANRIAICAEDGCGNGFIRQSAEHVFCGEGSCTRGRLKREMLANYRVNMLFRQVVAAPWIQIPVRRLGIPGVVNLQTLMMWLRVRQKDECQLCRKPVESHDAVPHLRREDVQGHRDIQYAHLECSIVVRASSGEFGRLIADPRQNQQVS